MTILSYHGQNIEQRDIDGYLNATQMCQAHNTQFTDWLRSKDATRYLDAISLKRGISRHSLTIKVSKGFPAKTAYWIHPDLAIKVARWISVDYSSLLIL